MSFSLGPASSGGGGCQIIITWQWEEEKCPEMVSELRSFLRAERGARIPFSATPFVNEPMTADLSGNNWRRIGKTFRRLLIFPASPPALLGREVNGVDFSVYTREMAPLIGAPSLSE
jgi:hypothetical protein